MRLVILIFLLIALGGCATTQQPEPVIRTVIEKVPVPVSCVPANTPAAPTYSDSDDALKAAPDFSERYRLLIQGRQEHMARESITEPVLAGCR